MELPEINTMMRRMSRDSSSDLISKEFVFPVKYEQLHLEPMDSDQFWLDPGHTANSLETMNWGDPLDENLAKWYLAGPVNEILTQNEDAKYQQILDVKAFGYFQ